LRLPIYLSYSELNLRMKLDPVFLVHPAARIEAPTSRRAFLIFTAVFAGGTAIGTACGFTVGGSRIGGPDQNEVLAWLRQLAAPTTPISSLMANSRMFLLQMQSQRVDDPAIWLGVDRIVEETLHNEPTPERSLRAKLLVQFIGDSSNPTHLPEASLRFLREVQ
jgi:hypothetical protein